MLSSKRLQRTAAGSMLILCAAGSASAADSGFYAGFDIGEARYPDSSILRTAGTELAGSGLDNTDLTWDLFAGYRFNQYLSVQTGHVDLGQLSGAVRNLSGFTAAQANLSYSAKGQTLGVVGTLPFGKWDLNLTVGAFLADTHLQVLGTGDAGPFDTRVLVRDTHAFFGEGVGYNIDAHWRLQFGLTTYKHVGQFDGGGNVRINGPTINALTVGIVYKF
jgi:hypothetical protein